MAAFFMHEKDVVVLVANTSWYLYNFRRGTVLTLQETGFRVVCLSPPDAYTAKLEEETGADFVALPMEGKSTRLLSEAKSLFSLTAALRGLKPAFVFNFTV